MMTIKQVASLTGVSVRALQYYDEIGLLKPADVTDAGYRLYNEGTLEVLQQILFFKELDFTLKEIKAILSSPAFDKAGAYEKQRELIELKRDRLNALLGLLDKLIKGEKHMEFHEFDLSDYYQRLAEFKQTHTQQIIERLGGIESFDAMVSELKRHEEDIAALAVKEYGSIEQYTDAMEQSLSRFLEHGPAFDPADVDILTEKTHALTKKLTADLNKDVASPEVQETLRGLIAFTEQCNSSADEHDWSFLADAYSSNPIFIKATDQKYGDGAAGFISQALKVYLGKEMDCVPPQTGKSPR